jgi:hypothetical protein
MQSFDDLVADFLAAEKIALSRPRWRTKGRADYAEANIPLVVPGSRLRGRATLTAHRVRMPAKYSFALLFRNERVLALDVNPGHSHRNLLSPKVVGSHWQCWPLMEWEAAEGEFEFSEWLRVFLARSNIITRFGVLSPPRGVQLELSPKWRRS